MGKAAGRGAGSVSVYGFWEGCPRGIARGAIARGKLCSGAVSTWVPFRQCSALCETHLGAARDVIEQTWIRAPIPVT